jgi:hypothetical protein
MKKFLLLLTPVLLAGCNSIQNLTPTQYLRNDTGLYPVEAAWSSRQQTLRPGTVHPSVMIGFESYPMRPVPLVEDRWETLIPVAADKDIVHYRFKFDFIANTMGGPPHQDSKLSQEYNLKIVDKK